MHQVIMNNMTMSALRSFGWSSDPPLPGPEVPRDLVIIQENEADPEIYHYYYQSAPYLSCPSWLLPQATLVCQEDPNKPTSAPPHTDRPAVPLPPPPPPPGTTATVGAGVAPAAESNSAGGEAEGEAEKKRS
ncbi:proline-rich protein 29-like [Lates calcarifer]|uniref:Proline-rich protein 29-like n=1 Tax=Lates calcarifer TaxID=8187 RepID=A0AAJ7PBN6_LATCA|nr:proline-rich protein 29-like [Lates calcarifer]XP_018516083.1 proline-rich protein 29-like [Lates calcarifer]